MLWAVALVLLRCLKRIFHRNVLSHPCVEIGPEVTTNDVPEAAACHDVGCGNPGVGARSSGKTFDRARMSLSSRRPHFRLPKLPWTVKLEGDLQQNIPLPHQQPPTTRIAAGGYMTFL